MCYFVITYNCRVIWTQLRILSKTKEPCRVHKSNTCKLLDSKYCNVPAVSSFSLRLLWKGFQFMKKMLWRSQSLPQPHGNTVDKEGHLRVTVVQEQHWTWVSWKEKVWGYCFNKFFCHDQLLKCRLIYGYLWVTLPFTTSSNFGIISWSNTKISELTL